MYFSVFLVLLGYLFKRNVYVDYKFLARVVLMITCNFEAKNYIDDVLRSSGLKF
jgi:hypothetical protein